jgi:hypothetical protein
MIPALSIGFANEAKAENNIIVKKNFFIVAFLI